MPWGIFRDGDSVQVSYEGRTSAPISRALYEQRGYHPPYENLPTREEYEANEARRS